MWNVVIQPRLKLYLILKLHGLLTKRPGQLIKQSKDSHIITHSSDIRFIQFNLVSNARIEDFLFDTILLDMEFLYHMNLNREK